MSLRIQGSCVLAAAFCLCASLPARAQSLSLNLGRVTKHGSFGLTIGLPLGRPSYTHCEPRQVWVPGHYETRCESVWVSGCTHQVWMPARFEWRWDACGRAYSICVRSAGWTTVTDPGHYESRDVQVWVAGAWRCA